MVSAINMIENAGIINTPREDMVRKPRMSVNFQGQTLVRKRSTFAFKDEEVSGKETTSTSAISPAKEQQFQRAKGK